MATKDIDSIMAAVERLVELFKLERIVYLATNILAFILLLVCAVIIINTRDSQGNLNLAALGLLFGSSGLMAASIGRLLRMWEQALQALILEKAKEGKDES